MSVEKRNGQYTVRWRDSSGRQRSQQVSLWRDAVALDGEMKRKKAMGELVSHERGTIRLNDFWELWCRNYATTNLTTRTHGIYARLWRTHIKPVFGTSTLKAVTPEQIASFVSSLNRTLAPSSTRKVLAILQGLLERAVEWGYLATNPAKGIKRPKLVQRRGRAITEDELDALCAELDPRSITIVRVLAYTGLRPGELRGLCWGDWTRDALRVERAVSGDESKLPKTGIARTVPLNPHATTALQMWFIANGKPPVTEPIFAGRAGKTWSDSGWNQWQQSTFAPAAARAGLKGLVPYDLRHTAISAMIAAGLDPARVARIAGHSLATLLATYAHEFELVYSECAAKERAWEIPRSDGGFRASL